MEASQRACRLPCFDPRPREGATALVGTEGHNRQIMADVRTGRDLAARGALSRRLRSQIADNAELWIARSCLKSWELAVRAGPRRRLKRATARRDRGPAWPRHARPGAGLRRRAGRSADCRPRGRSRRPRRARSATHCAGSTSHSKTDFWTRWPKSRQARATRRSRRRPAGVSVLTS